jgi:hypothetical protein
MAGTIIVNQPSELLRIPIIQEERLIEIGKWLSFNGEALFGTRLNFNNYYFKSYVILDLGEFKKKVAYGILQKIQLCMLSFLIGQSILNSHYDLPRQQMNLKSDSCIQIGNYKQPLHKTILK